jgi:hypothetical protein
LRPSVLLAAAAAGIFLALPARASKAVPACRLDNSLAPIVADTLGRAVAAYRAVGKELPIDTISVNPATPSAGTKALNVYVVQDAAQGSVSTQGCATEAVGKGEPLDATSVRGGCVVVAVDRMEMRCSAAAVRLFANVGERPDRASPALLYVLAHELAHLYQRRLGEYAGRTERIELKWDATTKLQTLRDACDPALTKREDDADAMSVQVLAHLVAAPPYREPLFSERGSLYWNIDQLALASDAWHKAALETEFISQPKLHPSFVPTEFPTPRATVERNARRFVCEVLTKRQGAVLYPGKSVTHPPLEQRLRRIAEALEPVATRLPETGAQRDFKPIARLQQDVSPILTHMYRETGVYLEAVQASICSIVNAPVPEASCR